MRVSSWSREISWFLLTGRGIKVNLDKCATIIKMRSPANVKEVRQLNGHMATLSRFLSANGDKGYPYLWVLRKKPLCMDWWMRISFWEPYSSVLFNNISGYQLGHFAGSGEDPKPSLLRKQGATRTRGSVSNYQESCSSCGVHSSTTLSLFSKLHCDCNDRPVRL